MLRIVGPTRASVRLVAVAGLLLFASTPVPSRAGAPEQAQHPPRLDSRLARVLDAFEQGGAAAAAGKAKESGIELHGDRVRVIVETAQGTGDEAAAAARHLGATGEGSHDGLVQVLVPLAALDDMAPGAQMYLANFDTEVELANASQWLTAQGVTIINASWGYFTSGPGDGTGVVDDVVTQSTAAGTLWSVAAGNHATQHWSGPFNDQDNNTWHEFQNSPFIDEGNEVRGIFGFLFAGDPVAAELKWDDPFGASCRDYDLYLKRTDDA